MIILNISPPVTSSYKSLINPAKARIYRTFNASLRTLTSLQERLVAANTPEADIALAKRSCSYRLHPASTPGFPDPQITHIRQRLSDFFR
jgi:hypothetical protein